MQGFQDENIRFIKDQGLYIWVNVIKLGAADRIRLFGGLDDDAALLDDPDKSWGEVLRKGGDILQTDWPWQLAKYRDAYFAR